MRKLFNQIESILAQRGIHFTHYLIGGQIIVFAIVLIYPAYENMFDLRGERIMAGEWWRLVTFLFEPIVKDVIFAAFTWYIFYIYGTALERWWGSAKFLLYLFIAALGTIVLAFIFPLSSFSNGYIFNSLFLAFAYLFPEFELRLFFLIPIKIKWLAMVSWIVTATSLLIAPFSDKIYILVSVLNFALFFGKDILQLVKTRWFNLPTQTQKKVNKSEIKHICSVCGSNSIDNPYMGIRYCKTCMPERCFCEEDFQKHVHLVN